MGEPSPVGKPQTANDALQDAATKAAVGVVGNALGKATNLLQGGAGEIRVYIEKNNYSIRVISFMGGLALTVISFLGMLNVFAPLFGPLSYVLKFYQFCFGLTIVAIDGPSKQFPRAQSLIVQYTPVLHNNLGRSLFYLFIASLEGTQDSWIHMLLGWYFLFISVVFVSMKAKSLCSSSEDAPEDDAETGGLKQMQGDI